MTRACVSWSGFKLLQRSMFRLLVRNQEKVPSIFHPLVMQPSIQVRVTGKIWKDMFDDGVEGVYQLREETATTVRKETQVNDPDVALEDADALFGKMQSMIFQGGSKAVSFRSSNAQAITEGPGSAEPLNVTHTTASSIVAAVPDATKEPLADQEVDESASPWQAHLLAFSKPNAAPKAQTKAFAKAKAKVVAKQVKKTEE